MLFVTRPSRPMVSIPLGPVSKTFEELMTNGEQLYIFNLCVRGFINHKRRFL